MGNATTNRSVAAGSEIGNAAGSGAFQSVEPGGVEPPARPEGTAGSPIPRSSKACLADALHALAGEIDRAAVQVGNIPADVHAVPWMAQEIVSLRAQLARLAKDADAAVVGELLGSFGDHAIDKRGCLGLGWKLTRSLTWGESLPEWVAGVVRRAAAGAEEARRERLCLRRLEAEAANVASRASIGGLAS